MTGLTSRSAYTALAAFQVGDAVACAIPVPYIAKSLDELGVPPAISRVLPVVKVAAALGLLSVFRFPGLARLTTAMLTLYFMLAVGAHIRVRDRVVNTIPAATFLVTFAAMTVKGPETV
ncbi:MAG TPA: DoxX family protein [Mycobacterium sp.]|nr:DoxX family protein [Mycobacterium sp.]